MTDIILSNVNQISSIVNALNLLNFNYEWVITIKRKVKKRTNAQNNLYWKWVTIIGNTNGEFKDDQHIILMHNHLEPKIIKHDGEVYEHYSIKKLNVPEMADYMNKISIWAASEGIILPHPEDLQSNHSFGVTTP
jgi:hypothetical protein